MSHYNVKDTTASLNNHRPILASIPLHIDPPLLLSLMAILVGGLFILYSASNESITLLSRQITWFVIAFIIMLIFAQIPPHKYYHWAVWLFGFGIFSLIIIFIIGHIGKGAQRWLSFGPFNYQPSELMKIALPMMLARLFSSKPIPPPKSLVLLSVMLILVPVYLIAKQPDLGTALIIVSSGFVVLLLSGIRWRFIFGFLFLCILAAPIFWHFLHPYQQQRVLTFLNPERAPLGAGYHIIQSKIAIGSGGIFGKGWLQGTQSHLEFLPAHATDFIFGVCGEEFGLIGSLLLIIIYLCALARSFYISIHAQDTFTRLLAGSLAMTFFVSFYVNIGMVTGILPVVGLPLPLISYGGSSMVTNMASFGILMSIHTHRKLLGS